MDRSSLVTVARSYIGVPYYHAGRNPATVAIAWVYSSPSPKKPGC
jgi:hypothetical protein